MRTDDLGNVYDDEGDVEIVDPYGNTLFNNNPTADGTAAFSGALADFILFGVLNGAFQLGPGNAGAPIDDRANPLLYWDGPNWTSVQAPVVRHVAHAGSPSGYGVEIVLAGTSGETVVFEQIVPVGGDAHRMLGHTVRLATAKTGDVFPLMVLQYLDAAGNPVGAGTEASSLGTTVTAVAHASAGASPPANAAYLRITVGLRVGPTAFPPDTVTVTLLSVRCEGARPRWLTAESDDPANYAAGVTMQRFGHLLLGGDGLTRGIAVREVVTPTTPPSGYHAIYAKTDSRLYGMDDSGLERLLDFDPVGTPFTPDLTAVAPGDLAKGAVSATGRYWRDGRFIRFYAVWSGTVTHSTASGALRLTGLPVTVDNDSQLIPIAGFVSGWTKAGYTQISPRCQNGTTHVSFAAIGSGSALGVLNITDIPSGTAVTIRVEGFYLST